MTIIVIVSAVVVLAYCGYLGGYGKSFGMRRRSETSASKTDAPGGT
jgi:hypothetical protein